MQLLGAKDYIIRTYATALKWVWFVHMLRVPSPLPSQGSPQSLIERWKVTLGGPEATLKTFDAV